MQGRKKTTQGFTLIELIVVIVILGILAAVAMPKFVDFTKDSRQAALDGLVSALNAATARNYNDCLANPNDPARCQVINASNVCLGSILAPLLPGATVTSTKDQIQLGPNTYNLSKGMGQGECHKTAATTSCVVKDTADPNVQAKYGTLVITCCRPGVAGTSVTCAP